MSELCDAVARLDVEQVKQLLALGHDPNGVRRLWWDDENDDELQPSRPLKMVVFRLSDCTHTEIENDALAQIARALLDAGADPHNALQLAEARYGDCSDSPWEAMQMVVKAAAATSAASKGSPAAAEASEGELTASTTGAKTIDSLYPDSFTVMSYNVLIPNSKDGWWIYKMYRCDTPHEDTEWPARQKLLQKQLLDSGADIICLQEMAGWSIDEDWEFLKEAGYDCAVYKKDRMRPGTFWRRDRFELWSTEKASVVHTDRMVVTLLKPRWPEFADRLNGLTTLEPNPASPEAAAGVNVPPLLAVVSGHLKAGFTSAKRRLQQMFKGLDALRKKLVIVQKGQKRPRKVGVMVCGDFNSGGRTAVRELLTKGEIHKEFREFDDGADEGPEAMDVTSKTKTHAFGNFRDCMLGPVVGQKSMNAEEELSLRYTMICRELLPLMLKKDHRTLTPRLLAALNAMFDSVSSDGKNLTKEEEEKWLLCINKRLDRGAEMRAAGEKRTACNSAEGGSPAGELWRKDFIDIYTDVVNSGGFAGMDYDVRVMLNLPGGLKEFDFHGDEGTAAHLASAAATALPAAQLTTQAQGAGAAEGTASGGGAAAPAAVVGDSMFTRKLQRISSCAKLQAKADGQGHVFCVRYDYMYAENDTLDVVARKPAVDATRMARLLQAEETLPNSNHPSDHLPIQASLRFK
eukprot:INCI16666.1.p1 GENE.INCI16666.1~~INCI16666.1.p1  ORF type:complete len:689 (-),score=155.48 INCI16666.1:45-2111(-)